MFTFLGQGNKRGILRVTKDNFSEQFSVWKCAITVKNQPLIGIQLNSCDYNGWKWRGLLRHRYHMLCKFQKQLRTREKTREFVCFLFVSSQLLHVVVHLMAFRNKQNEWRNWRIRWTFWAIFFWHLVQAVSVVEIVSLPAIYFELL